MELLLRMSSHLKRGNLGEDLAASYLKALNYNILERNWRFKRAEVDLICKMNNILVFIEVKTRSNNYFGQPEVFVDRKKERFLWHSAMAYMEKIGHYGEIRFDIIAINLHNYRKSPEIRHFEDVFF